MKDWTDEEEYSHPFDVDEDEPSYLVAFIFVCVVIALVGIIALLVTA